MKHPARTDAYRPPRAQLCRWIGTLLALGLLAPAVAQAASAVSSNWAGYVARPAPGKRLRSVSGTWTQPAVTCSAGRPSYSAVWVGLGGYRQNAAALEQIGTDSDCGGSGHAVYSAWMELLPAGTVGLDVTVKPGDRITASVTVIGRDATLGLRDLTSGRRVSRTVRLRAIDVSSAEWIVEAPSQCATNGSCQTLPLTDFGKVGFTSATATLGTTTAPVPAGAWSTTALQLQGTRTTAAGGAGERFAGLALVLATPTSAVQASGAFTVSYSERRAEVSSPGGPTLPGFSGGPPG